MFKPLVLFLAAALLPALPSRPAVEPTGEAVQVESAGEILDVDPITIVDSSAVQLTVQVSLSDLSIHTAEMADGNTYHVATVPGASLFEVGGPGVPVFGRWILIPNGTEPELVVDPGAAEVVEGIRLHPIQLPLLNLEDAPPPPFAKDEEVYGADADYPGAFAALEPISIVRGQQMALLWIYPYQFNPVRNTLKTYRNLAVTVRFLGDLEPIPARLRSETYADLLRKVAINGDDVLDSEEELGPIGEEPHPYSDPYGWDYLIFTHPDFSTAANTFAAWKNKQGFKTLVTVIPSQWKAADIRNAIQGAYDSWDVVPEYVLLIGDAEYVPTHYKTLHPYESMVGGKDTQGYTATDLYYVTLQGNDYAADIAIGRLSVDTAVQANDRVAGIMQYEKSPVTDRDFYDSVTIAAYFQDGVTGLWSPDGIADSRYAQTSEDLALFFSQTQYGIEKTVERIYYTKSGVTPTKWNNNQHIDLNNFGDGPAGDPGDTIPAHLKKPGFPWNGTGADITNAVQAGTFLLAHRDHGGRDKWSHPQYTALEVFLLRNDDYLPVVWSVNCQTGWFDNETDFQKKPGIPDVTTNTDESFAEMWERPWFRPVDGNGGAVGILAPTRVTDSIYNDRLVWGWTDAIWPNFIKVGGPPGLFGGTYRMGDVLNLGKLYMAQELAGGQAKENWRKLHFEAHHWFGDPAMEIRTEAPPLMVAVKPDLWPWTLHARDFPVHVDWEDIYGSDTADLPRKATVTISRVDSADYWVATTDEFGDATFPDLVTTDLGTYDIVVTAPNSIPYEGTFTSLPGSAGGLRMDAELYGCSSGIRIRLADADLAGNRTMDVVARTEGGDEETITLEAPDVGTGFFVGDIDTDSGRVNPGDGAVQVADGDTILVEYLDEDNGADAAVYVQHTARIDCEPPVFDGATSAEADRSSIELQWQAGADDLSATRYNVYRDATPGGSIGTLIATTWSHTYRDYTAVPGHLYHYVVRAIDTVGNEDTNTVEASARVPIPGDADTNCVVNLLDVAAIAAHWGAACTIPDPNGDPEMPNGAAAFDLIADCAINVRDIMESARHMGDTCP